jgi:hypothetical protein
MSTGPYHYRKAEELLAAADKVVRRADDECPEADRMIQAAKVHATLALAMATAYQPGSEGGISESAWREWVAAAGSAASEEAGQ